MIACHDEKNFTDATQFVPQRWLDCNENQFSTVEPGPGANLVLPFGIGRRTCPAKRFIEMELSLMVAKVSKKINSSAILQLILIQFQLYREFYVDFDGELEINFEFLLAPKTPVNISFKDRY